MSSYSRGRVVVVGKIGSSAARVRNASDMQPMSSRPGVVRFTQRRWTCQGVYLLPMSCVRKACRLWFWGGSPVERASLAID